MFSMVNLAENLFLLLADACGDMTLKNRDMSIVTKGRGFKRATLITVQASLVS